LLEERVEAANLFFMPKDSHAFLGWTKAIPVFLNWESKSPFWGSSQRKEKNMNEEAVVPFLENVSSIH